MPIPRYEGGASPFVGASPVAFQEQSRYASNLADRLDQWSSQFYERAKDETIQKAHDNAIKDLSSGVPARLEKGYTFYAKAYDDVQKTIFNTQVTSDINGYAKIAASRANNPLEFQADFGAYSKKMINNIQEPEFKAIAMQESAKAMNTNGALVAGKYYDNQKKLFETSSNERITKLKDEYAVSMIGQNTESANAILAEASAIYDQQINAGIINNDMKGVRLQGFVKEAYKNNIMADFQTALDTGKGTKKLMEFSTKDYGDILSIDEKNGIRKEMLSAIKQKTDMFEEAQKADIQADRMMEVETVRQLSYDYANGDLTLGQLNTLFSQNQISKKTYDEFGELMSAGANPFGDQEEMNMMLTSALRGGLSDKEILNNVKLSRQQQKELLRTNQNQKDEIVRQAIARQQAGTITIANEHIALSKEAEKIIKTSFDPGATSRSRAKYNKTVSRLLNKLSELRKQATEEGKSSEWIYDQTQVIIENEKSIQQEEERKRKETIKKDEEEQKKKKDTGWFSDATGAQSFLNKMEEINV